MPESMPAVGAGVVLSLVFMASAKLLYIRSRNDMSCMVARLRIRRGVSVGDLAG